MELQLIKNIEISHQKSFAILTQEILYRREPFYVLEPPYSIEDKLSLVRMVQSKPYRPFLGNLNHIDSWLTDVEVELLNSCWHEENHKVK